jgi:hypothetical protein
MLKGMILKKLIPLLAHLLRILLLVVHHKNRMGLQITLFNRDGIPDSHRATKFSKNVRDQKK